MVKHICTPGKIQRRSQGCLKPYIRYRVCTECGKEEIIGLSEDVEPHAYNVIQDTKATCTEEGIKILRCNQCGHEKEPIVTKATGHNIKSYFFYEKCKNNNCDYHKIKMIPIIATASSFVVVLAVSLVLSFTGNKPGDDDITTTEVAEVTAEHTAEDITSDIVQVTSTESTSASTNTEEATAEQTTMDETESYTEESTLSETGENETVITTNEVTTEETTATTEESTSDATPPATEAPTTVAPTTEVPTEAPTTVAPTTAAPTEPPTTATPTTEAPTEPPATVVQTTEAPTEPPTTVAPTTVAPTEPPEINNKDYSYLAGQIITGYELGDLISEHAPVEVIDTFGSKHYFNIDGKWGNPEAIISSDSYIISMVDLEGKTVVLANKF